VKRAISPNQVGIIYSFCRSHFFSHFSYFYRASSEAEVQRPHWWWLAPNNHNNKQLAQPKSLAITNQAWVGHVGDTPDIGEAHPWPHPKPFGGSVAQLQRGNGFGSQCTNRPQALALGRRLASGCCWALLAGAPALAWL